MHWRIQDIRQIVTNLDFIKLIFNYPTLYQIAAWRTFYETFPKKLFHHIAVKELHNKSKSKYTKKLF